MGVFISEYGGDLKRMLLRDFVRKGRGDDFVAPINEMSIERFGTLAIRLNSEEYASAISALAGDYSDVLLVGVEDMESGSPYVFVRMIEYGEKTYMFPTIINARLSEPSEDGSYFGPEAKSYSLRLGSEIDPERRCAMRIVYAPGKRIEWSEDELAQIFASLK